MPSPRTSAPSITTGSDALLYLLFGVLGAAMVFGSVAWLTGNLTNSLVGSGPWAPFRATDPLLHPEVLWPALSTTALLASVRVVPGLLTLALITTGLVLWLRWRSGARTGLARKGDLAPLLDKEADGSRHVAVKVLRDPTELTSQLNLLGWDAHVEAIDPFHLAGVARPREGA